MNAFADNTVLVTPMVFRLTTLLMVLSSRYAFGDRYIYLLRQDRAMLTLFAVRLTSILQLRQASLQQGSSRSHDSDFDSRSTSVQLNHGDICTNLHSQIRPLPRHLHRPSPALYTSPARRRPPPLNLHRSRRPLPTQHPLPPLPNPHRPSNPPQPHPHNLGRLF